jgi:hypothetical protein
MAQADLRATGLSAQRDIAAPKNILMGIPKAVTTHGAPSWAG